MSDPRCPRCNGTGVVAANGMHLTHALCSCPAARRTYDQLAVDERKELDKIAAGLPAEPPDAGEERAP